MKKVLITGVNGFLGSNLGKHLNSSFEIIGLEYEIDSLFRISKYDWKVYAYKQHSLENIFKEHEIFAIIHSATVYNRNHENINRLLTTNILLPLQLHQLAVKNKVRLFLNTDTFFNNESYALKYLPEYTLSKKHCLDWLKILQKDTKLVNMKIFHMYGPDDNKDKFIPYICNTLIANSNHIDLTYGEQKRDFIYIDDVVEAYRIILDKYDKLSNFEEFQVGTGNSITIAELIKIIKHVTKSQTKLRFGALEYRENEIMESEAEIYSLEKLGWKPSNSVVEGITKLINFMNS